MLRHNLTCAFRRLRSSPGFTAAAVVTLALGIGANTTIFSLVNAMVFRPFGVQQQNQLVSLNLRTSQAQFPTLSYPDYKDYRDRNTVLSGLAMYRFMAINVSRDGSANMRLWGYEVSGNYFDMLGVSAIRGRVLHPADDVKRGGQPQAVISYSCWQNRFSGDPAIAGKTVKIGGIDYTIVGVTPSAFIGTELVYTPEVFIPVAMGEQIEQFKWLDDRGISNGLVIGRLKPGVSLKSAQAAIDSIATQLGHEYPKYDEGVSIVLSPPGMAGNFLRGPITGFSAVLMAVAGMVLLIACVNLAGLLLARATDRRKETAIRLALGASRGQLLRQLLTESLMLSIAGGAAGILLAYWLNDLVNVWRPPVDVPVIPHIVMDTRVLLFTALISLITGLVFGLAPALQSTRASLAGAMKNDPPAEKLRRLSLRDILVTSQVALSVVLLIGSILVVRSLQHALGLNLGFQPQHAAVLSYDFAAQGYDETRGRQFQRRLLAKVRSLPGIDAAGIVDGLPLTLNMSNSGVLLEGKPEPRAGDVPMTNVYVVTPGYLQAMQTRLLAGRDLDGRDTANAPMVALVNEAFVRELMPGQNAVGKRFRHTSTGQWIQIAGVVEDGKYRSLGETPSPTVFEPIEQNWSAGQTLVARSPLAEKEAVGMLRRAVAELDPSLTVFNDGSLTSALGLALFPAKLVAVVLASFGLLAVVLAATGVYGTMAYAVSRRTREIGIRMALGAAPSQVAQVVLTHTAALLAVGITVGFALAFAAGKFFGQILYGISAHDPLTYLCAVALMAAVAFLACWVPTRRAIQLDPLKALRSE
ncbi:MAG TPA: ABC transporter permease [Bryobacteraceae bacterium]|nr:ABC transporter permease [Bryobacteraceae bacterium]